MLRKVYFMFLKYNFLISYEISIVKRYEQDVKFFP